MFHCSTQFLAGCVIVADGVFFACYAAIILIIFCRHKGTSIQSISSFRQQKRVLCLCMCVVLAFVFSSTPFTVMYLRKWKAPIWSKSFALVFFSLNCSFNPIIFLAQNQIIKRRTRKQSEHYQNYIELTVMNKYQNK